MVGVPGRSKGCATCRRRHIRCDERKPTCQRCERAGYQCEGYERQLIFQHSGITSAPGSRSPSRRPEVRRHVSTPSRREAEASPGLPQGPSLFPFEDSFLFSYLFTNYSHGNFGASWMTAASERLLGETAFAAVRAFAGSFYARSQSPQNRWMLDKSSEEHDRAMQLLREDLSTLESTRAELLPVSILSFIYYDNFGVGGEPAGYHQKALAEIIKTCGPMGFQEGIAHQAFECSRQVLLLHSLQERKRSFLEEEEWRAQPWASQSSAKTSTNYLIDTLTFLPGLLEEETQLQRHQEAIRHRVLYLLGRLYDWRWTWSTHHENSVFTAAPQTPAFQRTIDSSGIFDSVLQLLSWQAANELGLYNALQIWLLRILSDNGGSTCSATATFFESVADQRHTHVQQQGTQMSFTTLLHLPGATTSLEELATEILRVFEFQLANFKGNKDCVLAWTLPVSTACQVFMSDSLQRRLVNEALEAAPTSLNDICQWLIGTLELWKATS